MASITSVGGKWRALIRRKGLKTQCKTFTTKARAVNWAREIEGGSGVGALLGPTAQQILDGVKVMGGRERFGQLALKSMPANALYASAFKGGGTPDPMFAD